MKKISNEQWENIFRNIKELNEDEDYQSAYDDEWIVAMYLDPMNEHESKWGLCYGEELFEDYFQTEEEAQERLSELELEILGGYYSL